MQYFSFKYLFPFLFFFLLIHLSHAQLPDKLKKGLKYYIDNNDSSHFISLNMTAQLWARGTQNDPGTTVVGYPQSFTTDACLRRLRFVFSGQLTDRVGFFVQFGQNNFNYLSPRKAGSFFHDVTLDYAVVKKKLSIGMGLNGWNGPSRFSNASVANLLVLDPPGYQESTNDTYDQFIRRFGIYAKGKLGKLDYRVSAGKPFVIQTTSGSGIEKINSNATFSTLPPKTVYQGYFMYQFLEQESNFIAGNAGSYLGKKKIFNLGAGFYYQNAAMLSLNTLGDTTSQPIRHFAADIFYDVPVNKAKGTAYSLYACYSNYNFGTHFIKVSGPDNPASGSNAANGTSFNKSSYGNAFPYLGTGNIWYLQTAYKFKDGLLGSQGTLQPFIDSQLANYTLLNSPMFVFDIGINWLIYGNNSKITMNYQNRPAFYQDINGLCKQVSRKGEFVVQYQVAF